MKVNVYGIQRHVKWSYNGQTGENQRLHVMYDQPLQSPDEGYRVESIKVPSKVDLSKIKAGDVIEIYFNRYGAVDQVVKV